MDWRLDVYLDRFQKHVQHCNGPQVANLLSLKNEHASAVRLALEKPEYLVQQHLYPPWDEVVAAHLRALWCYHSQRDLKATFDCQAVLVQSLTKILQNMANDNWALEVMLAVVVDMRRLAASLDSLQSSSFSVRGVTTKQGENLEKAAELLMGLFRVCASDSRAAVEDSKKWGMMGLCNQLFKIYFRINKLNLCKPMVRAIDNMGMRDGFSLAQRITYDYYVGRKAIFEDNFKEAADKLTFAFERCHRNSRQNKRLILIYLIPVKMLLGSLPCERLLLKYRLTEFKGIVKAVRSGKMSDLNTELERHEAFFIKCGIYLLLEKLKVLTYRNLFKRVHSALETHLLPVDAFTAALRLVGVDDVDTDETLCILANLINEGKIKGYLAFQQQKLVVSKQQAFPPITA